MPALNPLAPARVLRPNRARLRVRTGTPAIGARPLIPVVYPAGHDDQLIIVETTTNKRKGRTLAEIRGATIDKPTWILNGVGPMGFKVSAWNDAIDHFLIPGTVVDGAGEMRLIGREVQFWRDGVIRWAGPPVTAHPVADGTIDFSCWDLGWHLARKFFGAAERRDLLRGIGSMDKATLPGWVLAGAATKARDTVDKRRGTGSMLLAGAGAASASFTLPARPIAPPVRLTAEVKVPVGTPVGTSVMSIAVSDLDGNLYHRGTVVTDEQSALGQWQRVSTYARAQNGTAARVVVTLNSPGTWGGTKFDDVRSLENNTTGLSPARDLAQHIKAAVDHLQTGRGQGDGFGFVPKIIAPAGTSEILGERHLNHAQWTDFVNRYTTRDDGIDWIIDPGTRELRIGPRQGTDHTGIVFHDRNVRTGGFLHDESGIAAKVVVPWEGDGVDRPEGGYHDASQTGGITYDDFWQPPAGTPLSAIDPMARQRHAHVSQPQTTLDDLAVSDEYLGTIEPGDTLTGTYRIGKVRLPTGYRIRLAQIALDIEAGQLAVA